MQILNKRELQQTAVNYTSDIDLRDLEKMYFRTIFFFS